MKIARLPTGELMEFPPDFPDDEMDRAVRQKLGLPEQHAEAPQELAQMLAAFVQQMGAMTMQIEQGFARLERAYLAETMIVTDKNGKPVGTRKVG